MLKSLLKRITYSKDFSNKLNLLIKVYEFLDYA